MKSLKYILVLTVFVAGNLFASADKNKMNHKMDKSMKHEMGKTQKHDNKKPHSHKDDVASIISWEKGKITIKVKGMVCAFCAQGIEKNFTALKEVKTTKVDLDKMEVYIELNKGKSISKEVVKKTVIDAGFSFEGVKNE